MRALKVLIALAIISIGISSISAASAVIPVIPAFIYGVANGELQKSGIGQIDFSLSYGTKGAATTQLTQNPIITAVNNGALLVLIQGVTITNANAINSFLVAHSTGGDVAITGLDVLSTSGTADSSVKNYNMYGYVTSNLAYAGQYADSITGEYIDMNSLSWNKATLPTSPPTTPPTVSGAPFTGLATAAPWGVAPAPGTVIFSIPPTIPPILTPGILTYGAAYNAITPFTRVTAGSSFVEKKMVNAGGADTSVASVTGLYQFAQAGGSQDPSAYPQGIWTQAVNDKGAKVLGVTNGVITDSTKGVYTGLNNLAMSAVASMVYNGAASLSSNAQEMGYSDSSTVYADKDTLLAGNVNTPYYFTTSATNLAGTGYNTADAGGNTPVQTGQKELFTYSIVNAANPNGFSSHLFF